MASLGERGSTEYTLAYGTHPTPADGRCAMEWVAHLAGEDHSDEPRCVSPVLRAICVALNDALEDEPRQRLRPYLTRTIGTADDGLDPWRAWLALDWLIRTHTPAWLAAAGLEQTAAQLAALTEISDPESLRAALPELEAARGRARALRGPGVPWEWRAAARETAWSCSGAAAWGAARLGIGDRAGDRARAAAQHAAGDAAAATAEAALGDHLVTRGRSAQRDAVRAALDPTRAVLTDSVLALLDRMLPLADVTIPPVRRAGARIFTTSV